MLEPLKAAGVQMTQDFDVSESFVVYVSSEEGLRALQALPQVIGIYENHRVELT